MSNRNKEILAEYVQSMDLKSNFKKAYVHLIAMENHLPEDENVIKYFNQIMKDMALFSNSMAEYYNESRT